MIIEFLIQQNDLQTPSHKLGLGVKFLQHTSTLNKKNLGKTSDYTILIGQQSCAVLKKIEMLIYIYASRNTSQLRCQKLKIPQKVEAHPSVQQNDT